MSTHIREGMELNKARRPLYFAEDWRARIVSDRLIFGEWATLQKTAPDMDDRARPYQLKGIGILCDEFAPISLAPQFVARKYPAPLLADFKSQSPFKLTYRLLWVYSDGSFSQMANAIEQILTPLNQEPRFHCMLRHLLESILRTANLAPRHIKKAKELGMESPEDISWDFIRMQILSIPLVTGIDDQAAPLQADGIPIVCNDVPPVAPN